MLDTFVKLVESYRTLINQQITLFREEAKLSLISAKWLLGVLCIMVFACFSSWLTFLAVVVVVIDSYLNNLLISIFIIFFLQIVILIGLWFFMKYLLRCMSFKETRKQLERFSKRSSVSSELSTQQAEGFASNAVSEMNKNNNNKET